MDIKWPKERIINYEGCTIELLENLNKKEEVAYDCGYNHAIGSCKEAYKKAPKEKVDVEEAFFELYRLACLQQAQKDPRIISPEMKAINDLREWWRNRFNIAPLPVGTGKDEIS